VFTAIILFTLAISIGANTAIFSVVEGVLLKPLAYPQPDQLAGLSYIAPGINMADLNMAPFLYFIDREQNRSFSDIGVYDGDSFSVVGAGVPERVLGMDVSASTLRILSAKPALGRLFTDADDAPEAPPIVLISYGYWQKHFGGDAGAVGRTITMDGKPRQIVGVLPRDFRFLDNDDTSLMIPLGWDRSKTKLGGFNDRALARLRPGVTLEQASADLTRLVPIAIQSFPAPEGFSAKIFEHAGLAPSLRPLKRDIIGDVDKVLWVVLGSLALVLMIACANVANLLLVRVEGRRQELAVRAALGAGMRRIAADLLFESLALGFAGSLLGLGLASLALRGLEAAKPVGLPRLHEIAIDPTTLLFTLGLALVTSLLIGAIPVLRYAGGRAKTSLSLREGSRGQSQSRQQNRTRGALVVLQVALALVLLICSGLMIRTFYAMLRVSPGFVAPETLETFRMYLPDTFIPDTEGERLVRTEQVIQDKLAAIPGVSAVSFGSGIPLDRRGENDPIYAQDRAYAEGDLPPIRQFRFVSPGYFATLGTRLVAGRDMTWQDNYGKQPVAVVSENLAKEYWQSPANALGKRIRVASNDDWREIVGVVADVHQDGVDHPAPTIVYWPLLMGPFEGQKDRAERYITFTVRSDRAGSSALLQEMQKAVWSVDADVPLAEPRTLGYLYTRSMARTSFTLVLLCMAGSMALLLGIVGIFGVISYAVSQRTREIGIRMALGAQRAEITGMFVRQGILLTGIGVVCGLGAALGTMRFLKSLLFEVNPVDPVTYSVITGLILGISWVACYLPSRRAASIEPVNALRAE
jgi:predicted permease